MFSTLVALIRDVTHSPDCLHTRLVPRHIVAAVPGILFLNHFHALLLGEIRKSCGTRSWSASGGRGTLSYHALDDRREGGVKANEMEAVRFGRIVPALLVSTHLRSAPRTFAGRN